MEEKAREGGEAEPGAAISGGGFGSYRSSDCENSRWKHHRERTVVSLGSSGRG